MTAKKTDGPVAPAAKKPRKPRAKMIFTFRDRRTGVDRDQLRAEMMRDYAAGASIRALAARYETSFGLARALLLEGDVVMRGKGGAHPRKPADQ